MRKKHGVGDGERGDDAIQDTAAGDDCYVKSNVIVILLLLLNALFETWFDVGGGFVVIAVDGGESYIRSCMPTGAVSVTCSSLQ